MSRQINLEILREQIRRLESRCSLLEEEIRKIQSVLEENNLQIRDLKLTVKLIKEFLEAKKCLLD
jgi:uncharacterized protein (UPF0335 family)